MNRTALRTINSLGRPNISLRPERWLHNSRRQLSDQRPSEPKSNQKDEPGKSSEGASKKPKKTQAQLDQELQAAMEGHSGDGGMAGAELEGGKAVSMKRGVRDNMFRYI